MSKLQQLKNHIEQSGIRGVLVSEIQQDYSPFGDFMVRDLVASGEFVTREYTVRRIFDPKPRLVCRIYSKSMYHEN